MNTLEEANAMLAKYDRRRAGSIVEQMLAVVAARHSRLDHKDPCRSKLCRRAVELRKALS